MQFNRDIKLDLLNHINEVAEHKLILILRGARQVGKTTILRELVKDKKHLFLDLERTPSMTTAIDQCADFDEFTKTLKDQFQFEPQGNILVIDEAQQSEKLGGFIRFMKEEWRFCTVIVSGSTVSEIYRAPTRQAVGRETYLDMWPLSFVEFLKALKQDSLVEIILTLSPATTITDLQHKRFKEFFNDYLRVGGLPAIVNAYLEKTDYRLLRRDILKSYENDFIRYFSLDDINLFRRAMSAVAHNVGSPSKDAHVARADTPGYKKVPTIYSRLEQWRLMLKHEQLSIEPEQNKAHPKRYLYDVGILWDLRLKGLTEVDLDNLSSNVLRTPLGGMIENAIALSLNQQFPDGVFGIRLSHQTEIDFGIKHQGVVVPIECKMALRFKQNYLKGLFTYQQKTARQNSSILLYGGQKMNLPTNVHVLPFYVCDGIKLFLERLS